MALGRPEPKLTPVSTFSFFGSSSLFVRPSQPSEIYFVGSAVCQMPIDKAGTS
jgi:hypothetical protein